MTPVAAWLSFASPGRVMVRSGKVELGQGIYAALKRIVAEELDVGPERIDVTGADTALTLDEGFTAGSLSVAASGSALGRAAATARTMLLDACAARHPGRAVSIDDGRFLLDGQPSADDYWTLAPGIDFDRPVADDPALKDPGSYRLLGREGPGQDLAAMVSQAPFIQDLHFPGMLHARMVRPPGLHGSLDSLGIDLPPGVTLVQDGGFVGIVAADEYQAVRLAERIEARARWTGCTEGDDPFNRIAGSNVSRAATPADGRPTVSAAISRRFLAHASIGLCCAVALWTGEDMTVWTHSQGVFQLRLALAKLTGLAAERIRVAHVNGAGCYGHNGADDAAADAALLSLAVPGRPVRVLWTRQQELSAGPLAPAMLSTATAALGPDGRIAWFRTEVVSYPHARRPSMAGGVNLLAGYLRSATVEDPIVEPPDDIGGGASRNSRPYYDIPSCEVEVSIIQGPAVRTSALRTLGAHVNVSAVEAAMDDAAAAAGVDPVEFRLRHLSDSRAREVVERAARLARWPGDGTLGFAFARYKNKAAYCAVVARVELDETARVAELWCAVDAGRVVDPDGVSKQIEGGLIQAVSWTLKEELPFEAGRPAASGWGDYPILGFGETPAIMVEVIDRPYEASLGVGEASPGPAAAAVCNAVARALGVRVSAFPMTRERMIEVLG